MDRDLCVRCNAADVDPFVEQTDRLYNTTHRKFQIARCRQCGMARLSPPPAASELSRFYPKHYWFNARGDQLSRIAEAYRALVLRDHVAFIEGAYRHAGATGPVLDTGCGGGLLPGFLRKRGIPAFGLDSSMTACALAWSGNGVPAVNGDLNKAPFHPRAFALITMFHVLEHLHHPAAYMGAARDLLRDDGRIVIQVPNRASWQASLFGRNWNGFDVPRHLQNFRAEDIQALLEHSGFTIMRRKFFSLRDNPAGFATSLAPQLDPVARLVRGLPSNALHMAAYAALVGLGLPFALLEAAFSRGSSVMLEARKR
jgi:SAM-dependent methyltransferase